MGCGARDPLACDRGVSAPPRCPAAPCGKWGVPDHVWSLWKIAGLAQGLDIAPRGKPYASLHGRRATHRGSGNANRRQPQGDSSLRGARHPSPGAPDNLRISPLSGRRAGAPDLRGAGPPAWTHAGRHSPYRRAAPVGRASLRPCPGPAGAEGGGPCRDARGSASGYRHLARDCWTTSCHLPAHRRERR
jgi:hypothetical protein